MQLNDQRNLRKLRGVLKQDLASRLEALGLGLSVANIQYAMDGSHCSVRLEIGQLGVNGTVLTGEAVAFQEAAERIGLDPKLLGVPALSDGESVYQITGYSHRARRYPLLVKCVSGPKRGNQYKLPVNTAQMWRRQYQQEHEGSAV